VSFSSLIARRPSLRPRPAGGRAQFEALTLDRLATERREENNFDVLRLFAALLVLFGHSFDIIHGYEPLTNVSWGDVGVLIFFSISGFLVCRSWDYNPHLGAFALKRGLRLLPGLTVALLVTAVILGPLVSSESAGAYFSDPTTKSYVLNNVLLQTDFSLPGVFMHNIDPGAVNGSLWTLPVEVKAYTLLAAAALISGWIRFRGLIVLAGVYAVIAMFPGARLWLPGAPHYTAFLTNLQMPFATVHSAGLASLTDDYTIFTVYVAAFGIGAGLYVLRRWVPVVWPLALVALAVAVDAITSQIGDTALFMLVFSVPYLVLWIAYRTHSFLRLPAWCGDYSYGIYVYAFPVQQTVSQLVAPLGGFGIFALSVVPTCWLAVLSWHFVEAPMLRLKSVVGGSTAETSIPAG
jgi:peptidoglycan/LPS O-acetylase OafA/YrhL